LRVFSQWEKDNLKAVAYKVTHQVTREAFEGLRHLTDPHMNIGSDFVANWILEQALKLSAEVYECCVNSCMCYTGEFAKLTECLICGEPRLDKCRKARNRFQYILIIPRLQAMYKDPKMIKLLLYRVQHEVEPGDIEDVFDGEVISNMMKKYLEIDGVPQEYKYGKLDMDIFIAFTCNGVSIHKGLGAWQSKTQYLCFPLEVIILNLPPMVRTQNQYVFSLGVIPGPCKPKHLDSFCWPFYLECHHGIQGICMYHMIMRSFFPLHFFVPHGFGNLIAVIKMKSTHGIMPRSHATNVTLKAFMTRLASDRKQGPIMSPLWRNADCCLVEWSNLTRVEVVERVRVRGSSERERGRYRFGMQRQDEDRLIDIEWYLYVYEWERIHECRVRA